MTKQVLFIQGGSEGAYAADAKLAASLRTKLGPSFNVRYPSMPDEDEPEYHVWKQRILQELAAMGDDAFLVGHSIGASVVIKLLTEADLERSVRAVFLVSTPFWYDHEFWRWDEVKLPDEASTLVPTGLPIHFYHGRADESVPFNHMGMYAKALPNAIFHPLEGRDHQLNDDLSEVASAILAMR
jgi:predicted alpha/beta hydrolase family esterase